jgi:hypothetical protein
MPAKQEADGFDRDGGHGRARASDQSQSTGSMRVRRCESQWQDSPRPVAEATAAVSSRSPR